MNKIAPLLMFLLTGITAFSQVGIGTTDPQSTLDVNGTLRVSGIKSSFQDVEAVRIVGLDEDGNFVEVEVDENLILENNQLRALNNRFKFGTVPTLNTTIVNNINLIIWPGEPNDDKTVIKIYNLLGDFDLHGIFPGQDGQRIYLYPQDGRIRIIKNSLLALPGHEIDGSGMAMVLQYGLIELMYDATRGKWVIMEY